MSLLDLLVSHQRASQVSETPARQPSPVVQERSSTPTPPVSPPNPSTVARKVNHRQAPMQQADGPDSNAIVEAPNSQFCIYCGAGIGPYKREGEGTCPKCDPPNNHKTSLLTKLKAKTEPPRTLPPIPELKLHFDADDISNVEFHRGTNKIKSITGLPMGGGARREHEQQEMVPKQLISPARHESPRASKASVVVPSPSNMDIAVQAKKASLTDKLRSQISEKALLAESQQRLTADEAITPDPPSDYPSSLRGATGAG